MKKEDKNRLFSILQNYNNISILIGDLLNPIKSMMEKYSCSEDEACNIKLRAEEYLKNYGCMTLDATTKAVKNLIDKTVTIEEEEEKETLVPIDAK
jgi:hypothetical protein